MQTPVNLLAVGGIEIIGQRTGQNVHCMTENKA